MPTERFMRHHYGASGYVDPKVQAIRKAIDARLAEINDELDEYALPFLMQNKLTPITKRIGDLLNERKRLRDEAKGLESQS